jgi:hypothetical protein
MTPLDLVVGHKIGGSSAGTPVTTGQQAMAHTLIFPEAEDRVEIGKKSGRGKKSCSSAVTALGFAKARGSSGTSAGTALGFAKAHGSASTGAGTGTSFAKNRLYEARTIISHLASTSAGTSYSREVHA